MQAAPPPVDPILMPRGREQAGGDAPYEEGVVTDAERLLACLQLADDDPQAAIAEGARWLLVNNGVDAELCTANGYEAAGQWSEAEQAYLRAARVAEGTGDVRHLAIVASAGRTALAQGEAATAKTRFDQVLASETISDEVRGNVLAERARAHVGLDDGNAAQADLMAAQRLLPNEPAIWLLSATLARRQGDLDAAGDFIDRALELDQRDPATLLEAGNIAIRLNAFNVAREAWGRASEIAPASQAGQAAARNIARLDAMLADEANVPVELPEAEEGESLDE